MPDQRPQYAHIVPFQEDGGMSMIGQQDQRRRVVAPQSDFSILPNFQPQNPFNVPVQNTAENRLVYLKDK